MFAAAPAPRIFLSYAHSDGEDFARELRRRLESEGFSLWQERTQMEVGKDWWDQIDQALRVVEYMVPVLTPAAVRSPIIVRAWRLARRRGVCVIPVFGGSEKQLDLSSLPRWMRKAHVASTEIPDEWTRLVRTLQGRCQVRRVPFLAPDLPADFVPRPGEFDKLIQALLEPQRERPVAIATALKGAGGYGKTTLAAALCHDERIEEEFHDGILWVTLGREPPDLVAKVTDLIETLAGERPSFREVEAASARLAEELGDRDQILVIDDVWRAADARPFLRGGTRTVRLLTTRDGRTLPPGARWVPVDAMEPQEAAALLGWGLPETELAAHRLRLQALAARLGEWPLLLKLANGALRLRVGSGERFGHALGYVERVLNERGLTGFDASNPEDRNQAAALTLDLSLDELSPDEQARFLELAVFPENVAIPIAAAAGLWAVTGSVSEIKAEELLVRLFDLSLLARLDLERRELLLHDVVRGILRHRARGELAAWNARFLEAQRPAGGWPALGRSEAYLWEHLAWHLAEAGRRDELRELLLDLRWLEAKLNAAGPAALLADFRYLAGDEELEEVEGALRLASHVLAQHPEELAAQLLGRLARPASSGIEALLGQAAAWRGSSWLKPRKATLTLPGGALIRTLLGHLGPVRAVAVTPDGRRAVSGSGDRTLKIWDLESGQALATLRGHSGGVRAVAITPDGRRAVSGSGDKTLKIWDLQSGRALATLQGHSHPVTAVVVTPDGRRAVSGSEDKTLNVWHLESGQVIATFREHSDWVSAVAATPDSRRAISGSNDGTLKVWDLESGQELATLEGHAAPVSAVGVTPDSRRAISGSNDGTLKVWDLESGQELATLEGHSGPVDAVAVTGDGRLAVSGSFDETLKVWDLESVRELATLRSHTDWVKAVAIAPDGRRAVSGSWDNTLKVWDLESGRELATLEGHLDPVRAVAVTPDGRRAVSGSFDRTLKVWDLKSGRQLATLEGHSSRVDAVAVTPDGRRAVSGSWDNTLKVWDLESGRELATLEGHSGWVTAVAVAPDGRRAVSGYLDRTLKVWDLGSGRQLATLEGHSDSVSAVAITPDGRRAISGSEDDTLKIWDLESGRELATLQRHSGSVYAVAVTPDGSRAVSGSWDRTLKVWDLDSGRELATLEGHSDPVRAVAVTPDGRRVVSASDDATLRVWDLESGRELARFTGDSPMLCCAVAPDGVLVVAGGRLGRLHFLELIEG